MAYEAEALREHDALIRGSGVGPHLQSLEITSGNLMKNTQMETRLGQLKLSYSARGIPAYTQDLWHDGLKKHRLIRGDSQYIVQLKARLQVEEWEQKWAEVDASQRHRAQRALGKRQQEERKSEALDRTTDAQQELALLSSLLKATLKVDDKVDWESLKDKTIFPEPKPKAQNDPPEPSVRVVRSEPRDREPCCDGMGRL